MSASDYCRGFLNNSLLTVQFSIYHLPHTEKSRDPISSALCDTDAFTCVRMPKEKGNLCIMMQSLVCGQYWCLQGYSLILLEIEKGFHCQLPRGNLAPGVGVTISC
jgi:hypothetical protein